MRSFNMKDEKGMQEALKSGKEGLEAAFEIHRGADAAYQTMLQIFKQQFSEPKYKPFHGV